MDQTGPREASNAHNLGNGAARKAIPTTPLVPAPLGLEPDIDSNHNSGVAGDYIVIRRLSV
jgi:hypothetical protein